jgi:hypothetical protein
MASEPTAQEVRQGVRRLHALLPAARASVRRGEHRAGGASPILQAQQPWIRQENFGALVIYPAPLGGFHADLHLKYAPPGVSNVLGTPVQMPCRDRAEAETVAFAILCLALQLEADTKAAGAVPKGDRQFLFHSIALTLPAQVYNEALDAFPNVEAELSETAALERLDMLTATLFGGATPTYERVTALSREAAASLQAACLVATLAGIFRYPPKPHMPATDGPFLAAR